MPTKQRNQVRKGSHGGMQLVLTEDVPYLGKQGELVEVRPGYGRNYLLPQGLATLATAAALKELDVAVNASWLLGKTRRASSARVNALISHGRASSAAPTARPRRRGQAAP